MTKTELIEKIANEYAISKNKAANIVNSILNTIVDHVAAGEKVTLTGFGVFESHHREARTGRNPQNGEPIEIPAKNAPVFHAGKGFKDAVNE